MPMTWDEVAYERYLADEAMDDLRQEFIGEFAEQRLQSYFLAHPDVTVPALGLLAEARALLSAERRRAALVFAAASVEVVLEDAWLRPVLEGLVHSEPIARLIADQIIGRVTSLRRFEQLLVRIVDQEGGVNLKTFSRPGVNTTLWSEIDTIQVARNRILHAGKDEPDVGVTAETAIDVAGFVLETMYPEMLKRLHLHQHDDGRVCNDGHAREALEAARRQARKAP